MKFQFRLETVLRIRQRERDLQQQSVAKVRANYAKCVAERGSVAAERTVVLDEIRMMNEGQTWAIDQVLHRQRHAEQLGRALTLAEAAIIEARSQLESCLQRLVFADQSVRALERLKERQLADFQYSQAKFATYE